ncbi:MAG: VTT domain-containing protein [Lachnospiraceae bacterium]|nr:VTT domain-containing protein [Lachnospiraceae bacterium]
MKKHKALVVFVMLLFLLLLFAMVIQLFPLILEIVTHARDEASVVSSIHAFGWRGVPALIALSALQVIIPVIPAPAIGILTGLSYGIYAGPFIFLGGITLGNIFVMVYVRQVGGWIDAKRKHQAKPKPNKTAERFQKIKRPEIAVFFLFLLPFVSSLGPYMFARTKVVLWKYSLAVLAGSIPSTVMYIFLGDRISAGHYTAAIITAAIVAVVCVFILIFRKKLMEKILDETEA